MTQSSVSLIFWAFFEIRRQQGEPLPSIKISLLLEHQRPKLKIGRAASLDIILNISHTIFCTNRMIRKGRKLPAVFKYLDLFLQLHTWYKLMDSLDIVKNLQFLSKGQWTYGNTYCLSIDTHICSKRYKVYFWVFLHEKQPKSRQNSARGNHQRGYPLANLELDYSVEGLLTF